MVLSTVGFAEDVDQVEWARLNHIQGVVNSFEGVASGFVAAASTSTTRGVVMSGPAAAYACGVRCDMDVNTVIAHPALSAGQTTRLDYGVLQFDWATKFCTLVPVQGSASTYPTLTRNPGVRWQMPLYTVTVTSAGLFDAADVVERKPIPRHQRVVPGTPWTTKTIPVNSTGVELANILFEDPGWPFTLEIVARATVDMGTSAGTATIVAQQASGTEYGRANGDSWASDLGGAVKGPAIESMQLTARSPRMTGRGRVQLMMIPRATTASVTAEAIPANEFYLVQIPA